VLLNPYDQDFWHAISSSSTLVFFSSPARAVSAKLRLPALLNKNHHETIGIATLEAVLRCYQSTVSK